MDVVQGGAPAPAINIVCPHYLDGADPQEQHIIYSVQVNSTWSATKLCYGMRFPVSHMHKITFV